MAKLTLDDLRNLRDEKKRQMTQRSAEGKRGEVTIGMGTCGIAAGAKIVFDAFLDEMEKAGITDVTIKQTGCMGLCFSEPTVEVSCNDMPHVVYGNVDEKTARRIVREHLEGGALVSDHIFDKPSTDIIKGAE
ncbi:MAG: NADP-reducing hydrogenase subunit HndB [Verrucomicrobiota bacterium]|jgi:NADP-reducing hydrogenase subunit HndB|nr:NADP-reducing hydrogenase subunit HndB [Verrucomicrobiota bacterium]MDK2962835.1 NADP-reducing hydrogenase subunit HndB [Verrucomicrobiota bacterium]